MNYNFFITRKMAKKIFGFLFVVFRLLILSLSLKGSRRVKLLHRLMTYLFRANGGKYEGWIAKKKRSSLRSHLAFASVHLENEKIASLF